MTTEQKPVKCHACGKVFEDGDWHGLEKHILENNDARHKPSRKWAHKFAKKEKLLNQKKDKPERRKLTKQEKENKKSVLKDLSGANEQVETFCPNCKRTGQMMLPAEYTEREHAWRLKGKYAILCSLCRREVKYGD